MSLAEVSVKRPVFITCVVLFMLAVGYMSMKKLPVDLFPNITFPIVMINVPYPGAGPAEIETLVAKVLEDELSSVPGIKSIKTTSKDGLAQIVTEFSMETDVKNAESQVRDRVTAAKRRLPTDVKEPMIRRLDPADQPVLTLAVRGDLSPGELFQVADENLRPKLEQVNRVGLVTVLGGRKREIRVNLDQKKLKAYELSATQVASRIGASGQNVPVGKFAEAKTERSFRTMGEYQSLDDIRSTIVNFLGNDVPVAVKDVATVTDELTDIVSETSISGEKALLLMVFKQSGTNTVAVADELKAQVAKLNASLQGQKGNPTVSVVRDLSVQIRNNLYDVNESIIIGIILTIIVVYFFLGSFRSTIITGLALPNSLLGAFILMSAAGFTINVMTLLALSLAVGLLVDDAIVVRENIFRHIEDGESPKLAAINGTKEVTLAVIATTLAVIAVFGPIAFLKGIVGQFFKEFGLTICFAMVISLFDALTIAPMLSAYFAGSHAPSSKWFKYSIGLPVTAFDWIQTQLEKAYEGFLKLELKLPWAGIIFGFALAFWGLSAVRTVPKTFMSPQDNAEFNVSLDLPPGASLESMRQVAMAVDQNIRAHPEVDYVVSTVGNRDGQPNVAELYVKLVPSKKRSMNTSAFKEKLRADLVEFVAANPQVKDIDAIGGGMRPFALNIIGSDMKALEDYSNALVARLKSHPALKDVDTSFRSGKPEVRVVVDRQKAERLGVSTNQVGGELRTLVEGAVPAVFRQDGFEYNIRVRLQEEQRNLKKVFNQTYIPNINNTMLKINAISRLDETTGPSSITRSDRGRYVQVSADIAANGPGLNGAMESVRELMETDLKLPAGMRYAYVGQAESFGELKENITLALFLSMLFIYLVMASLYESFVTPVTIMLVLPLAASGAMVALNVTGKALDINSMIGCILLMGIAVKNSILLVDFANQQVGEGIDRKTAMINAGRTRLRPILMTTVALIAGMLPIAIGLNEASKQRTPMGVAVIGGLISSTILGLIVIPAAYIYIDRMRVFGSRVLGKIFLSKGLENEA